MNPDPIQLRPVVDQDLSFLFEIQNDSVANQMAAFLPRDPADRPAFMEHWERIRKNPDVTLRVIVTGPQIVGWVASFLDAQLEHPEVTYWIGREHWGRGIATAALGQFLEVVTTRPLYGRAALDNRGSIRVLEKCGFEHVGQQRSFATARGTEIDEVVLRKV